MNLLILKGFNNYFNRKIKKYSTLQDYIDNSSDSYNFANINFNPNDGVTTSQVIGSENQQQLGGPNPVPLMWEQNGSPDYLVAYTTETIDEQEIITIHSRWFVLESVRTRNGQYQLALKRDIIADHLEQILTNPCFVEKGYVKSNNPLIFNEESVSLNQIKKGETPLKDETQIPWIVLYIAKNYKTVEEGGSMVEKSVPIEGKMTLNTSSVLDYDDLPWSNLESSISASSTNITRRVKGASEINISPILAIRNKRVGAPNVFSFARRINCRFGYSGSNDWVFDSNTSNYSSIGASDFDYTIYSVLRRGDIGLTPADNRIHWNDDGVIVPSMVSKNTMDPSYSYGTTLADAQSNEILRQVEKMKNSSITSIVNAWNNVKTYLNSKRTAFESNTLHSTVPDNPNMEAYVGGNQTFLPSDYLLSFNNKIVQSGTNYFRIKISRANNYNTTMDHFILSNNDISVSSYNELAREILYPVSRVTYFEINESNSMVETRLESGWFDIQYERVQGDLLRFTLPTPTERNQLNDAAYDMICFPYGKINFKLRNQSDDADITVTSSEEASIGIARSIASQLGDAVYDVQLLPYCPYREVVERYIIDNLIDLSSATSPFPDGAWSGVYKIDSSGETPSRDNARSFGLWCISNHGTFDIKTPVEIAGKIGRPAYTLDTTREEISIDYKVRNACKRFRLVSPNYSSVFEFNPLKNNGVDKFNVDFTYKPFNPYIHIAPFFKEGSLYGVDRNDARGLILQGDFSVGYYSDKWAQYQIQNANYANIFDRQIQNIDFNQAQEREKWNVNRIAGWVTESMGLGGGIQGAKAFSGLGPWGMLGGGIGGTVGGIIGHGIGVEYYDRKWMNESMAEERSYATDMYNLNLGNVKALPYGLAKSDALTENFKYFPFIEEYDCTDVEKEMFRNKLKYDGMTVMAIATIAQYLPEGNDYEFQKVKGRMIMLDNITDDFQIANDIYTEVNKGFYYIPVESEGE